MDTQSFEKTSISHKINMAQQIITNIQKQIITACQNNNIDLLKQQLSTMPSINIFKALYMYSNGIQKKPREFIAKIDVSLDLIKKDIQSCIQFIKSRDSRLSTFSDFIALICTEIIAEIEKQKQREFTGFMQNLRRKTLTDMIEDEITQRKVQTFWLQRSKLRPAKKFSKHTSSSFSNLPNPFFEIKYEPLIELEEEPETK